MKRYIFPLVFCLIAVLLFGGCTSVADTLVHGDYKMEGDFDEDVETPYVRLDTELGEFLLAPGPHGTFADYGTYTLDGDTLLATSYGNVYTFRVVDGNTLVFESAKTTQFIDLPVGARFVYAPEGNINADDLLHAACVL